MSLPFSDDFYLGLPPSPPPPRNFPIFLHREQTVEANGCIVLGNVSEGWGEINEQKDDYHRSLSPLCPFPRSIEHIVSGSGSGGIHCTCTIAVSCCFRREERFQLILSIFVRTIIVERYAFSFAFLLKSPPAVCQNIVSFAWRKRERERALLVCLCVWY